MVKLPAAKMSSKRMVVLPEHIRQSLLLRTGSEFVVIGERDVLILKILSASSAGIREFSKPDLPSSLSPSGWGCPFGRDV